VRKSAEQEPEGFPEFYAAYRRKDAKADAIKAWRQLNPDVTLQADILAGLARWKWSEDRSKIPLPASWLRGRRWEDESVAIGPAMSMPDWVKAAGFECEAEAHNRRCWAHNAHQFKDGKRIAAEVAA
jgi:hypothetical protein